MIYFNQHFGKAVNFPPNGFVYSANFPRQYFTFRIWLYLIIFSFPTPFPNYFIKSFENKTNIIVK